MSALSIWRNGLWAPLVVIVLHYIAGGIFGHEPYVDPIMHFSGGAAAAFFFWQAATCSKGILGNLTPLALALLAFGLASAAAVGWEIAEFASDVFLRTNIQRDIANTMRDLILGLLGAGFLVSGRLVINAFSRKPGR